METLTEKFDLNKDGKVNIEDAVTFVRSLGLGDMGEKAVRHLHKKIDKDQNGELDAVEIWALIQKLKVLLPSGSVSTALGTNIKI